MGRLLQEARSLALALALVLAPAQEGACLQTTWFLPSRGFCTLRRRAGN